MSLGSNHALGADFAAATLPIALVFCFVLSNGCASAQPYPNKVIRLIVPAPSGGGVDALSRVVGQQLQNRLGQEVVVENRPGAGTTIGTKAVALAEPDGYTLLMAASNHMIAPVLYQNLGYDPIKSFAPVAMVTTWSHLMVVRPGLTVRTVQELVTYAKANPGKVSFGLGIGTAPQIIGEYLKVITGAEIMSVPYRGSSQAITDTIGDRIDIHISPVATMCRWWTRARSSRSRLLE